MNLIEFLSHLRNLGIELRIQEDRLRVNAPKGVLTPAITEDLKLRKEEILAFLRTGAGESGTNADEIKPVERTGPIPMSFSQERLWFLDQLEPGNSAYNLPGAIRLRGKLNLTCLEQVLNEIIARHEILRTNFDIVDNEPVQIIIPQRSLPLPIRDLRALSPVEQIEESKRLIKEESQHPFDLRKDPLVRATLLKLGDEDHIFMLTFHHIVSDGWSRGVFTREFLSLYEAFIEGRSNPLTPLPIQYADFAVWQRKFLQGDRLETQLAYWKGQLNGDLPQMDMLLDKPRPATPSNHSQHIGLKLPIALSQKINELSQAEGATLFMTMLAAFKLLLQRYTGLEDIVVGSPIAGRNRAEIENLIGFFINTLVMRTNLSGKPTFRELIQRVKKVALDAYTHQDLPFEALLIELHPERDLNRTPLFQVFFNMLNLEEKDAQLPGLVMEGFDMPDIGSKFDLTMYVAERGKQIELTLVYNMDLFYPERMTELLSQYQTLLTQIVSDPDQPIQEFSLETELAKTILPNPQHKLSSVWNEPVSSTFMKQAKRVPNNIALVDKFDSWTYRELDVHTSQLAHYLQANGLAPHDMVAVYAHRSAALIVALLAVWKAGGAFLILDPAHPAHRQLDYLRGAQPKGWLQIGAAGTAPEAVSAFVKDAQYCRWLEIPSTKTQLNSMLGHYPSHAPDVRINAADLAYIAFTSGSTGQPKGIVGTHGPIAHFFQWQAQNFGLRESDHFSMLSGLAHDPVLRDIFTPLTIGAKLCIPEQEEMLSSTGLFSWMKREQISVAHMTPAMEQILASRDVANQQDRLDDLRYAFLAGETLTWQHVESLKVIAPAVTCVNFYGATETPQAMGYINVSNICDSKDQGSTGGRRHIPLGKGIEGVQLLVLTAAGQRAGIGEIGEIHIRTPYLSQGYLHDDALTQQRFIINPFLDDLSDRMYKTGDLGRYRPNGDVEFMGRNDRQVKIRGFRVELSEIESVLNEHSQVNHSIASVWKSDEGDKQLTAYVVLREQGLVSSTDLREYLRQRLPSYMIPGTFVFLDIFPVTPNGKINYGALPAPDQKQGDHAALVRARNSTEEKLVAIWEDLLKKHPIGVKDSFFELGGHSLIAVHMFTRINREFEVNLPLATLFQESTIEYLANVIDRQTTHQQTWSSLIPVEPKGRHSPFFCIHGLTGDILWFRDLAHCLSPDYPFYGLQSRGLDGIQTPLESIEEMAAHYIQEIRQLQPKGPYYLGGASFGGTVALEMAQQLLVQGEEVSVLASFDHAPPNVCVDKKHSHWKRNLVILYRLIKNFPAWLKEFIQLGPSRMLLRVSRKIRFIQKVRNGTENDRGEQLGAEDLIDFAGELAPHRQQLITYNFQALKKYVPKPYAGNVILFRALNRPLLRTDDPEAGWQNLAPGRVKTFDIPSSHEGMFKKPYVEEVAEKLRTCLTKTQ